jgi:hypothetical protein
MAVLRPDCDTLLEVSSSLCVGLLVSDRSDLVKTASKKELGGGLMKNTLTKLAAAGALTLSATAAAMAGSVTQPGESIGLATGAPLPPGFYFVETTDWGSQDTVVGKTNVGVTIPVLAWSTPWKVLNARVQLIVATPALEVGVQNKFLGDSYQASMYNPFIGGQLAWDLGGGFGFSYLLGAYIGVNEEVAAVDPASSLNQRFALSYTGGGWNLTANAILGTQLETVAGHPDYLNVDLTATKTFGKWEVGAVGFYATDLNIPVPGDVKTSKFAAGGLLGYDWGAVKTQAYLTRDVAHTNMPGQGYDTRLWGRIIVPLGDPFAAAPSSMLYHK